jgi:flagellar motor switch protein FliN/FliY
MSENPISQNEMDALLAEGGAPLPAVTIQVLQNFARIVAPLFSADLETQTGAPFVVDASSTENIARDTLLSQLPDTIISVDADFSEVITGKHSFFFGIDFAQRLTDLINKEEGAALDDLTLSIVSDVFSKHMKNEVAELSKTGKVPGLANKAPEAKQIAKTDLQLPQNLVLFSYLANADGTQYTLWEAVTPEVALAMAEAISHVSSPVAGADIPQSSNGFNAQNFNIPNVQGLSFQPLQGSSLLNEPGNIGIIMDVPMEMTVELGRTRKQVKEILSMGEGTIVELDKLAGEPVDILVNHKPIAKGEVVVIDENFGVRVTEILSPMERVNDLQ